MKNITFYCENDSTETKWRWIQTKLGGTVISPRCSISATVSTNNSTAYCFGGVFDKEDEEDNLVGIFFNDFYSLDTEKFQWKIIQLTADKVAKLKINEDEKEASYEMREVHQSEENVTEREVSIDGVFKVTLGLTQQKPSTTKVQEEKVLKFQPCPRINCGLAIKRGNLYIYGGMFEIGDKQITLNDFHSIDLKKLNEWKTIISDENSELSWVGSESESSSTDERSESEEEVTE